MSLRTIKYNEVKRREEGEEGGERDKRVSSMREKKKDN